MGPRGLTASRAPRPFLDGEDFRATESGRRGKGQCWDSLGFHSFLAATLPSFIVYGLCSILQDCTGG